MLRACKSVNSGALIAPSSNLHLFCFAQLYCSKGKRAYIYRSKIESDAPRQTRQSAGLSAVQCQKDLSVGEVLTI